MGYSNDVHLQPYLYMLYRISH